MTNARFAPHRPTGPVEHYKERLLEVGRLAAVLDRSKDKPLDVILRFFKIDDKDKIIVLEGYRAAIRP